MPKLLVTYGIYHDRCAYLLRVGISMDSHTNKNEDPITQQNGEHAPTINLGQPRHICIWVGITTILIGVFYCNWRLLLGQVSMQATRPLDFGGNKDKCRQDMIGSIRMCQPTIVISQWAH